MNTPDIIDSFDPDILNFFRISIKPNQRVANNIRKNVKQHISELYDL